MNVTQMQLPGTNMSGGFVLPPRNVCTHTKHIEFISIEIPHSNKMLDYYV